MQIHAVVARLAAILLLIAAPAGHALDLLLERVATGLSRPVYLTHTPGDNRRLFILEQHTGRIRIYDRIDRVLRATPFLTVSGLSTGSEQGLLGLAFHPNYANNRFFYVNYTDSAGNTQIRRFQRSAGNANLAVAGAGQRVLQIVQPFSNHNGGWIEFGPDELLYIASGDGGSGNDPGNRAQDITNQRLGKMLRIDVDGDDFPDNAARNYSIPQDNPFVGRTGDDEIWAYGLRNPWRASFDRVNGNLYIADVGQDTREEINFQPATNTGGRNYGWRLREGRIATPADGVGGAQPPGGVNPVYDYEHGSGAAQGYAVTGGYVYRGPVAALRGRYFFADYITAGLWNLHRNGGSWIFTDWTERTVTDTGVLAEISSFGEDALGNLYIVDHGGEIYRIAGTQ